MQFIKPNKDLLLIRLDSRNLGIEDEITDSRYRNRGTVLAISKEASEIISEGDIVHFSDTAGVYPYKKKDKHLCVLHKDEILFTSDDDNIFVGEDLSFYFLQELANSRTERIAKI